MPAISEYFKSKEKMKTVAVIPCHNHADTLPQLLAEITRSMPAVVVDDGSDIPVKTDIPEVCVVRLEKNSGKAAALKAGFARAREMSATHAITIDADGQHPPEYAALLAKEARKFPQSIIIAARDFDAPQVPKARRFMNKFSNFWFAVETGMLLGDTQCGLRCYPLDALEALEISRGGFAFEVELLVKAAWAGFSFREIAIPALYTQESLEKSHYRPIADTVKFSLMNTDFFLKKLFLGKRKLREISLKK